MTDIEVEFDFCKKNSVLPHNPSITKAGCKISMELEA